jgi:DNA-binding NtrC family response regulator
VAIIVTAYASSSTAHVALAAGAWRIVSKPVDVFLLEGLISQALDQPLILVVVDDADFCRTLWELLREHGYRVCLANNLSQVHDNLASRRYRVVLIDLNSPEQDGTEVFRVVREENPEARTIVTTSHPAEMEFQIKNVVAAGADAVCYKPFDVDQLLTTIERLVR